MLFSHSQVSANGIDIHYVREGAGHPLVFLHGWPEFWRTWRKNLTTLSETYDVVAPDLRGFGATEKPDLPAKEGYTVGDHVADLQALTTALDIEKFGLVSHDLGALIAQQFAREYPKSVTGLFFFDCPYPGIGDRWLRAEWIGEIWYQSFNQQPWAAALVGSSRESCATYIGHFLTHWADDPEAFDREDHEAWIDNFLREGNLQGGFNWYVAADEARKRLMREGAPSLPTIDVPTRVLWGKLDPVLRVEWADRLDEYFSNCKFDSLPHAGHFAHYERPERANSAIRAFFSEVV
ncbi:alpha/beta fold hydrolase [Halococcus salifodinae]|uniref:Alpha/beta hydrolase fold protein n=1 Tax=Halococcus salifodinae DSM 8989 TaxID=1227456 RepID=M0NCE0_9EURY|nr:alpha/beta hydrolase [Halococcus salifodinae]EMA54769.1 alpha/beta hydrolase fold protein [Halococcus salifodinae DSM 8989]